MRKITCAFCVLIGLLAFSCKNETTSNQAATVDVATTKALDAANLRAKRALRATMTAVPPDTLRMEFHGLVAFMIGNGSTDVRAVVPNVSGHVKSLSLPDTFRADLESAFTKPLVTCDVPILHRCYVELNGMAFQVVTGSTSTPFQPSANFSNYVTHLTKVPGVGTTFDYANLKDDVFKTPPPKASDIAGVFELAGGKGDAYKFSCPGHFHGEATYYDWPSDVIVDYPLATGAKLQVWKYGDNNWSDVTALSGSLFFILDNENPNYLQHSHFQSYTVLSKTPITLPDVEPKPNTTCIGGFGDVPGCSDSQWP